MLPTSQSLVVVRRRRPVVPPHCHLPNIDPLWRLRGANVEKAMIVGDAARVDVARETQRALRVVLLEEANSEAAGAVVDALDNSSVPDAAQGECMQCLRVRSRIGARSSHRRECGNELCLNIALHTRNVDSLELFAHLFNANVVGADKAMSHCLETADNIFTDVQALEFRDDRGANCSHVLVSNAA